MPRGKFSTINVPTQLKDDMKRTADETAKTLHMTELSLAQLINMMHTSWQEKLAATLLDGEEVEDKS